MVISCVVVGVCACACVSWMCFVITYVVVYACVCVCVSVHVCEQLPGNQSFDRQISAHKKGGGGRG